MSAQRTGVMLEVAEQGNHQACVVWREDKCTDIGRMLQMSAVLPISPPTTTSVESQEQSITHECMKAS